MQFYLQGLQLMAASILMRKATLGRNDNSKKKKKPTGEREGGKAKNAQVTSQEEQCWGPRLASPLGLLTSAAGDSNGSCVISLRFPTATHTLSGPTWALLLVRVHEALRPH